MSLQELAAGPSPEATATGALAALAVVIVVAAAAGKLAGKLRQPVVVGEIAAGVLLGPSALGLLPGNPTDSLFPPPVVSILGGMAQLAIACYMFGVGYETDLGELRRRPRGVAAVAGAATAVPMLGGIGLGFLITALPGGSGYGPLLPIFTGILLSITAVPVLTRVLDERGLRSTPAGVVSLGAAAACDGIAWLLLAGAISLSGGSHTTHSPLMVCALLAAFTLVLFTVGRRLLGYALARVDSLPSMAALTGILLASAWFTSWLGLHAVFGALLCGIAAPRRPDGTPHPVVLTRLRGLGTLLLPAFFVVAGLGVHLNGIDAATWLLLALVCATAVAVKLFPSAAGARLSGLDRHQSLTVGALMNTRGLTELIAVQVAYTAGVIDTRLYAVFVLMALLTTAVTGPLLDLIESRRGRTRIKATPAPTPEQGSASASRNPQLVLDSVP
ncbi:cation:proton antiporter [Streptomyces sp. LHD-70]|uniref:cation:proton antiporter n=1 Tax=Streptomyces sp. LHD-70 TaxID=3072140 RepID=UPI00280CE1BB|nr:cation:proton antiporter [Streptomyces sp. LHD-70]MDQ8705978.1 cation:proton antiporter [Streptomyces sp. LHD-70]